MAAPTTNIPRRLTEVEYSVAFIAGGGIVFIIVAFFLAVTRNGVTDLISGMMLVGILAVIGGTIAWVALARPSKDFDDLTTPLYTGHAHHDAPHHAETLTSSAETHPQELIDHTDAPHIAEFTTGEPYLGDHPALAAALDTPPEQIEPHVMEASTPVPDELPLTPPIIMDPMSAFTPDAEPLAQYEPHVLEITSPLVETIDDAPPVLDTPAPNDLRLIKGIGPKINGILNTAGIFTFADLAKHSPAELEKLIRNGEVKAVIHPETWIDAAARAATGDYSLLEMPKA